MKVVYIASSAHSGSTLLDLMLNGHSRAVTVGEIKQLPRYLQAEKVARRCTCGAASVRVCPFWIRVDAQVRERSGGRTLADLNIDDLSDVEACKADNRLLFEAVASVSGAGFVVDSSKDPLRLQMLLATPGLEILPIFLVRNPKGQILSMSRSGERKRKAPESLLRLIVTYSYQNVWFHRVLRNRPHFRVRYEELVQNTTEVLTRLMRWIGVEYEPQQQDFAVHERHNVGGNRMRRQTSNELRLDESWRLDLKLLPKVAIDLGTFPGRYAFRKLGNGAGGVTIRGEQDGRSP